MYLIRTFETNNKHLLSLNIKRRKMKITQIRENGDTEALSVTDIDLLIEKMKKETKLRPVTGLRQALHFVLPDEPCSLANKLPRVIPAAAFERVNGVKRMKTYNGIVELTIGPLAGKTEVEIVKQKAAELPQTMLAFMGASGKSVKIWTCFTRPDGTLPQTTEEAEVFQAHAYRLAIKCYQPQLPFNILLKEPKLEQFSRLSYDPDLIYRPTPVPFYLSQPIGMPGEMTYHEKSSTEASPLNRALPGYDTEDTVALLYEAALRKTFEEMETDWHRNDHDLQTLVVPLAENCYYSGIPEEEVTRRTITRYYKRKNPMLVREMIRNVYKECKGVPKSSCLTKEQRLSLQMDEFMNRRYEFRRNVMTGVVEHREQGTFCFQFRPVTDLVYNSIALNAQLEGLQLWDRDVRRYINSDRVKNFSPIDDFLQNLPHWDGHDYIRELAGRVKCDNPHWQDLFYRWFLGMVAYWQERDTKHANSTSPLLVGPQGIDKSTFCTEILPPELHLYYTDDLDFSEKRHAMLYLNRFALINLDEFDQISVRHQGFLKHLLQKPSVNVRRPNSAYIEKVRRYASFIATSNHEDLLNDPSGSRRFICVHVSEIDNSQPIDYRQLYAQAVAALDSGERYWFTREEGVLQTESNREFQQQPLQEQLYYQYFRGADDESEGEWMLAVEIFQFLQKKSGIKLPSGKMNLFGRFLSKLGILTHRTKNGVYYKVVERTKSDIF